MKYMKKGKRVSLMRQLKILITMLAGAIIFCSLYRPKVEGKMYDQIAAIVNGEIITQREFRHTLEMLQAASSVDFAHAPHQLAKEVLQSLIDEKLQVQEARGIGLSVYPEELEQGLQEIKAKNGLSSDGELEKALLSQNMTLESLRAKVEREILLLKLRDRAIHSKIHLTDSEISSYFDQHRKGKASSIHLSHILFALPEGADETVAAQVHEKARQVWKELEEGQDFIKAAQKYSEDAETARQGGDLGYLALDQINPLFKKAIEKLNVGQVSPPVRTPFGFHLIRLNDHGRQSSSLVRNSAQWNEIKEILMNRKAEQYYRQWLEELRERSYIEIKTAGDYEFRDSGE
jgi:peptidyl-prolyl cis-trans isomerase SurA